jgi:DNA-directed RNA polymerase subunit N (RpoN/RPB10)
LFFSPHACYTCVRAISLSHFEFIALVQRKLIPAGSAYVSHVRRAINNISFEEYDRQIEEDQKRLEALNGDGLNGEDDLGVGDEEESPALSLLDPKEWKVNPFPPSSAGHEMLIVFGVRSFLETRSLPGSWVIASAVQSYSCTDKNRPCV